MEKILNSARQYERWRLGKIAHNCQSRSADTPYCRSHANGKRSTTGFKRLDDNTKQNYFRFE